MSKFNTESLEKIKSLITGHSDEDVISLDIKIETLRLVEVAVEEGIEEYKSQVANLDDREAYFSRMFLARLNYWISPEAYGREAV